MSPKRLYYVLLGLIGLLAIGLLVGAYEVNSLLTSRAQTLTGLKAKSLALQQEQYSLASAQRSVKNYAELEKIAESVVPEDKDQAETVRQIVNIAAAHGISLAAINFPASSLGSGLPGTSSGSTAGAPVQAAATPVKSNSNAGKLSQLQPVKNIPGVYVLQITVQGDHNKPVPYASFIGFLDALEHNRRTALISGITLQPNATNPNLLTFTLTLNEYIKP